jgi:hypothetical protein
MQHGMEVAEQIAERATPRGSSNGIPADLNAGRIDDEVPRQPMLLM